MLTTLTNMDFTGASFIKSSQTVLCDFGRTLKWNSQLLSEFTLFHRLSFFPLFVVLSIVLPKTPLAPACGHNPRNDEHGMGNSFEPKLLA